MMTPGDNLIGLYRRQGYAFAPVGFGLCPSLREKYKAIWADASFARRFALLENKLKKIFKR
jgi:hypothetical protein